jgi:hypothetical protein
MGLISRAIPTLLRGISQASDATKQDDHADLQDNADSNPVLGLTKRSGLEYVSTISNTTLGNVHIHTINRDVNRRFISVFSNGNVRVFELDGTERTVQKPDGTTYLNTTNPRDDIKTVTIADFTFVVNKSVVTAMDTSTLTSGNITQAIIFVSQVSNSTTYSVTIDGVTVSDNTANDSTLSTTQVATDLRTGLAAGLTGFTFQQNGPVVHVKKTDGSDFSIDGNDTQGNQDLVIVKNSIQRFSDLPTVSPHGYVVEINGDDTTDFDNYYVKFVANNSTTTGTLEEGHWEECAESGIPFKFNYNTMPHILIRQSDGDFRFARVDGDSFTDLNTSGTYSQSGTTVTVTSANHGLSSSDSVQFDFVSGNAVDGTFTVTVTNANTFTFTAAGSLTTTGNVAFGKVNNSTLPKWGERTVGDIVSAPDPSFIGKAINNVFFYRSRLGVLADDNVILTTVSEFFQFFRETVLTIVDSDPIDVSASHTKVSILKHAVPMAEQLILFSDQTQFILTSSSVLTLTPKTATVVVATEFESSDAAPPVASGNSIYYLTKKGTFAGVREYITQEDLTIREAANITVHVPRLIPVNIFKLAISTSEDVLICLGTDNPNQLFVNRWLFGPQGTKILNSWSTYTINSNRTILNADFIGTDLFLVIQEANGTTIEKIPFEADVKEANATFKFCLDHKVTEATTGVSVAYNATTDVSTFTVPYRLRANMNVVGRYLASGETSTFVDTQGNTKTLKAGRLIPTSNSTDGSTSTITASGDFRNSKFIIGEPYEMHYRFSQRRLNQGGQGRDEILSGRLQLHHFYIKFEDTGFFKVEVTPENRSTSTHKFTGRFLGLTSSTLGNITLESGTFKVPIMSRADRVDIDVKNDTFLPTQLASAEYEAMFHLRSRRT